ncbi:MAG: hypothetical protein Q8N47_11515 [Bryobacterales bacterium]|nr:hypothetical protein [Bryobacterales bacterium]
MPKRLLLLAGVLLFLAVSIPAQEVLNNNSILKLLQAGIGEDMIVNMINSQPGKYSLGVDDVIAWKKAGVSDKVMAAMIAKNAGGTAPTSGAAASDGGAGAAAAPAMEIGVYFKKGDAWTELLPEVVNWRTGGALKNLATAGIVKKDLNGNVAGPSSRNSIKSPMEFLIVASEGVSITEYQLIRLRLNKNYREFRTVTGGILNQQSGAMRDLVPFEGKRVAPRTFSVVLPSNIGAGEYGFLSPGATGSTGNTQAQIGKMYTFHLLE